jgi:hypothetical protein
MNLSAARAKLTPEKIQRTKEAFFLPAAPEPELWRLKMSSSSLCPQCLCGSKILSYRESPSSPSPNRVLTGLGPERAPSPAALGRVAPARSPVLDASSIARQQSLHGRIHATRRRQARGAQFGHLCQKFREKHPCGSPLSLGHLCRRTRRHLVKFLQGVAIVARRPHGRNGMRTPGLPAQAGGTWFAPALVRAASRHSKVTT